MDENDSASRPSDSVSNSLYDNFSSKLDITPAQNI